jgi:hypothetical protein
MIFSPVREGFELVAANERQAQRQLYENRQEAIGKRKKSAISNTARPSFLVSCFVGFLKPENFGKSA